MEIHEDEDGSFFVIDPHARTVQQRDESENLRPNVEIDLRSITAHCDRGGSYLRRLNVWQEIVEVLNDVENGDYGVLARLGRFSVILPDALEQELRSLQGHKIAILRTDKGYSVISKAGTHLSG